FLFDMNVAGIDFRHGFSLLFGRNQFVQNFGYSLEVDELSADLVALALQNIQQQAFILEALQDNLDLIQRKGHLPQSADGGRLLDIPGIEMPIPCLRVDLGREEQSLFVIQMDGLDGKPGDLRELADAEQF